MRRQLMCVPMILLCLALSACGGSKGEGQRAETLAIAIRAEYLGLEAYTAHLDLTADYGQRVYTYGIDASWQQEETVLVATQPEQVAGITAHITGDQTALEFDGARIETGALSKEGLSPIDAVPAIMTYAKEGFIAECVLETLGDTQALRVCCRQPDAAPGVGTEAQLWFDASTHVLLRGELAVDGFTVIQCVFSEVQMTVNDEREDLQ